MDNDDIYNRTVLPLVLRLKLAQPFNRFPFSGAGRVSSELQRFRSNHLIDGHIYGEQEDPHGTNRALHPHRRHPRPGSHLSQRPRYGPGR